MPATISAPHTGCIRTRRCSSGVSLPGFESTSLGMRSLPTSCISAPSSTSTSSARVRPSWVPTAVAAVATSIECQ